MTEDEDNKGKPKKSELFTKLEKWITKDLHHLKEWYEEAVKDFDFVAGEQWSDEDKQAFKERNRVPVTFNRTGVILRAVSGAQITNPQQIMYKGRGEEDRKGAEINTQVAKWFLGYDYGDAAEAEAFYNASVCGVGFTETRLDYDASEEGEPSDECIDSLEMGWDFNARSRNLTKSRRMHRRRRIPLGEAKDMFGERENVDDFNATWAHNDLLDRDIDRRGDEETATDDGDERKLNDDDLVTIVHIEWHQMEDVFTTPDGQEHATKEEAVGAYAASLGFGPDNPLPDETADLMVGTKKKRVYRYAYLGNEVLKTGRAAYQTGLRWRAITAFKDLNKGLFYGMVRDMRAPQMLANKLLSQLLHLLSMSAKGGVMAEENAFEDKQSFKQSWSKADEVTIVAENSLVEGRIQPKPTAQLPQGTVDLMVRAEEGIRAASGVSQEMLAMREANQPNVLESNRIQQGMTLLAPLFKSLEQYRASKGKLIAEIIARILPAERIHRVVGDQFSIDDVKEAQAKANTYDTVVDQVAATPTQREAVWSFISGIFNSMPPQAQAEAWSYAPLPESASIRMQQAYQASFAAQAPDPAQVQLDQRSQKAEILSKRASALEKVAKSRSMTS